MPHRSGLMLCLPSDMNRLDFPLQAADIDPSYDARPSEKR
jgi:hypothetical protein